MPSPEGFERNQDALLWAKTGVDRHGQQTVSASPMELKVRWVTVRSEGFDPQGNRLVLDAMAVVDRVIVVGSLMWLGTLDEWTDISSTLANSEIMEVKTYSETPDLKAREQLRTVGLMKFRGTLP